MLPLLAYLALAADYGAEIDDFATDAGAWTGDGAVAEGALRVTDGEAILPVANEGRAFTFTLSARVRMTTEGTLSFGPAGADMEVTIVPGDGAIRFGGEALPLPMSHLEWQTEADPVFEATGDSWEAGGINHPEVFRDDDGTWFLYYTAYFGPPGYAYRQIGLATSPDGISWTRYAGNPVLTIDYDLGAVDGVHVHMPTVTRATDGTWHMFYACYQNNVGNRLCHATSPDGYAWTPQGVVLDRGATGEFDDASLRMPDVWIAPDGVWHLWYDGTSGEEHYGPTGYATSLDGWTWTRQGEILDFEHSLQGLSVVETPYGLDAIYNRDDFFNHAFADPADPATWTETGTVLTKGWSWWNDGYIQAPSLWLDGTTYRMWFNGYTYTDGFERVGAAHTEPVPGTWLDVELIYDLSTMKLTVDGIERSADVSVSPGALRFVASGTAELDDVEFHWVGMPEDSAEEPLDTGDSGSLDTAETTDRAESDRPRGDCGCASGSAPAAASAGLSIAALPLRRRRR